MNGLCAPHCRLHMIWIILCIGCDSGSSTDRSSSMDARQVERPMPPENNVEADGLYAGVSGVPSESMSPAGRPDSMPPSQGGTLIPTTDDPDDSADDTMRSEMTGTAGVSMALADCQREPSPCEPPTRCLPTDDGKHRCTTADSASAVAGQPSDGGMGRDHGQAGGNRADRTPDGGASSPSDSPGGHPVDGHQAGGGRADRPPNGGASSPSDSPGGHPNVQNFDDQGPVDHLAGHPDPDSPRPPSCEDNEMNGGEADVDCGGECPPCPVGAACMGPQTCASGICDAGRCAPARCGDAVTQPGEACDDGNTSDGDGCSSDCHAIEAGWRCDEMPCTTVCGDGQTVGSEACDDGNTANGDGCAADCRVIESGWHCHSSADDGPDRCTDIDECAEDPCGPGGRCQHAVGESIAGTFTCECAAGYQGGGLNAGCRDVDECENIDCGPGGTCSHRIGEINTGVYTCRCAAGFEGGGIETPCVDIDECLTQDCGDGGTCHHRVGEVNPGVYRCDCAVGYQGGGIGTPCQDVDE
ncbi:MAG: DUF4215 domain-containing protein, partial [Myxococcota bacterium]|nr:DUF4215 domain-containing protein [Myxococcota bacterium]